MYVQSSRLMYTFTRTCMIKYCICIVQVHVHVKSPPPTDKRFVLNVYAIVNASVNVFIFSEITMVLLLLYMFSKKGY